MYRGGGGGGAGGYVAETRCAEEPQRITVALQ